MRHLPLATWLSRRPKQGIVCQAQRCSPNDQRSDAAPADLLPRLARCYLAEDRAAAQRLALQYPDTYFLLAGWRLLSRPRRQRRQEDRQRTLGLKRELREVSSRIYAGRKISTALRASSRISNSRCRNSLKISTGCAGSSNAGERCGCPRA